MLLFLDSCFLSFYESDELYLIAFAFFPPMTFTLLRHCVTPPNDVRIRFAKSDTGTFVGSQIKSLCITNRAPNPSSTFNEIKTLGIDPTYSYFTNGEIYLSRHAIREDGQLKEFVGYYFSSPFTY